jgi:hypothetical protein
MKLTTELVDSRSAIAPPVVSVYCQLLPVSPAVRGTSAPATGLAAAGTRILGDTTTDMGAVAHVETAWRGRSAILPIATNPLGLNKQRHGVTRGRPPRDHLKGLHKPDRTSRGPDSRRPA